MTKIQMTKSASCVATLRAQNGNHLFLSLGHSHFEFVSNFVLRISDFVKIGGDFYGIAIET